VRVRRTYGAKNLRSEEPTKRRTYEAKNLRIWSKESHHRSSFQRLPIPLRQIRSRFVSALTEIHQRIFR
jgi:hypothetical protein